VKVFVFTYDRYETISTSAMLEGENIDHVVRWAHRSEYGILVLAGFAALLIVTSFGASYAPARRAARIDPAITLRSE